MGGPYFVLFLFCFPFQQTNSYSFLLNFKKIIDIIEICTKLW